MNVRIKNEKKKEVECGNRGYWNVNLRLNASSYVNNLNHNMLD